MASSLKPQKIYDVFLSFRGANVRKNFLGHLYKALDQNGIYTFRDSEELRKGDQISAALMKAIEESCIAIIIFSEDYASSWWCLEEVAKIMECKEQKNLTVLPVFYEVDPREVREGRKSYQRALAKHELKFGKDSEKVKRWKKALSNVGNLSGWHLNDGDESELIQEIVEKISTYLARTPLYVAKHPVGIDSQVVKLKSMLNLDYDDGVLMVGLWGQGGIGKTSLAKALYNAMFRQFEGSCFLANVRETSKASRGLVTLQEILLNDILLPQQRLEVSNVDGGIHLIQRRLGHKKVLLILDDVDDLRQLNTLVGDKWLGNGSRIIITTRDKHLLTCHGINQVHVYEVQALDDSEAHELLSQHAFLTHQIFKIRTDLMKSVLHHANGLPLALEVLGSFLCGRREHEWESTLKKLSGVPNNEINEVLKISYDGLEENEKEIFLDIACFFKGKSREYVKKVLDSCNLEATIGLEILIERSLIRNGSTIQMHDLIQFMGMEIVNQECRDNPGKRNRLWRYSDVFDVLSSNEGDRVVKAIVLELPKPTEMCINPNAFTNMRRLRLLILHNVRDSFHDPICLPNELRWFEWPGCSRKIPEFSSGPKKLVGLNMSGGNIIGVVKQFKDFQNLKYINFSQCESLVCIPDLSCTPNLEELDLQFCKNLVEAHESIAYLDKLQVLNFRGCSELSVFPNELNSKILRTLNLEECTKFERFPNIPHKLEALTKLYLGKTAIKGLPASIENLVSLRHMHLSNCKNLMSLPSSIYKLQNLEYLYLNFCTNLIGFPKYEDLADPHMKTGLSKLHQLNLMGCNLSEVDFLENLSCSPFLTELLLSGNNITGLPTSINKRHHLSYLLVQNCHQLQEIPELPPFLNTLGMRNCESLQNWGDLFSVQDFVRRGLTMADIHLPNRGFKYYIVFPRGEMPEWVFSVEKDSISFMASKELYDKFLGVALCVALNKNNHEEKMDCSYRVVTHANGIIRNDYRVPQVTMELDHIQLLYLTQPQSWGVVDFGQIEESHVQFSFTVFSNCVKKWGIRIFCKQLEDDLKVVLQDDRLIDPALLYEIDHESICSEVESLFMHEGSWIKRDLQKDLGSIETDVEKDLQDHQRRMERDEKIAPKRKHGLIPAQGKRIKTTSTSDDSTDGEENDRETCQGSN